MFHIGGFAFCVRLCDPVRVVSIESRGWQDGWVGMSWLVVEQWSFALLHGTTERLIKR
jgi:hypothetical protein